MATDVAFRIGGQAGQGIQTISYVLGRTLTRAGYHVFASQDVMSRIRGGHNFADVRACDRPVAAQREKCDLLIALDEATIREHRDRMVSSGATVYDSKVNRNGDTMRNRVPIPGRNLCAVPLTEIAGRVGKEPRMRNSVALGAVLSLTGHRLEPLLGVLREQFAAKGSEIVSSNLACARAGFEFVRKEITKTCPCRLPGLSRPVPRRFMSGAEAVGLGAVLSGLQFYAGYPMSPSTPILEYVMARAREHGIVCEQSEDELSAINMAIGASVAGARAMTASSGGGFSLMVEGLSLAGMTETPVVIALCSRPGPATGLATRQAQADLLFALHAGHGEFNRVLFAPGTAEQAFYQTNRAFDLAEKYQVPAILLLDQHINESYWTVEALDESRLKRERYLADPSGMAPYRYQRYSLANDSASPLPGIVTPMLRPGSPNQVRCDDSDEHTEEGHITESAGVRRAMVAKRLGKAGSIGIELSGPECYPAEPARTTVLCFGSTFGVVREAVDRLREQGASVAMMHLSELAPFPRAAVLARLGRAKRVITLENNATAQLARLVTTETRLRVHDSILKYDGRPFRIEETLAELEKQV
jgi:2-oxoglutarate ferredoxin oxidoreductase subunit alpha